MRSRLPNAPAALLLLAYFGCSPAEETASGLDLSACEAGQTPEVFLGRGVGGAFEYLAEGEQLGLSSAPQGGMGVSVLVGTRGLRAGEGEIVSADLTAYSPSVETSAATFTLDAALECMSDGPDGAQGVIYGVVVGFNSSLGNSDLLLMDGQPAELTITVRDADGVTGTVTQTVTLVVGA
jgi:hypothetical protein